MDTRTCPACGDDYCGKCPTCYPLYEEDMRNNHIPPQYVEAGVRPSFLEWAQIKRAELELQWLIEAWEKNPHLNSDPNCDWPHRRVETARKDVEKKIRECVAMNLRWKQQLQQGPKAVEKKRRESFIERMRRAATF